MFDIPCEKLNDENLTSGSLYFLATSTILMLIEGSNRLGTVSSRLSSLLMFGTSVLLAFKSQPSFRSGPVLLLSKVL